MKEAGLFIAVVGPSGAGKDTILGRLKARLPAEHFLFPPRVISRVPDASEESLFLAAEDFTMARERGDFLVDWEAHGLYYGISSSVRGELDRGRHVIANLSRAALPALRAAAARVRVVHITVRKEILEQRLRARGREFDAEQQARLARGVALDRAVEADILIENNGAIENAVNALLESLLPLAARERLSA